MSLSATALADAAQWVAAVATGSVATGVATIAVAAVGFAMLAGRIDVRRGARVILGCFIVFGAPTIAAGFTQWLGEGEQVAVQAAALPAAPAPPPAQPHDPYAGASLIR
ncbi:TrbC/VirB2 family protein [Sphingopyxis sp. QXT-31]|uniref:TrbC/VirB2 family protein n=1 Tax=Sphingopyxis sp. QXT-31 TaxID=1357916 RepID=UPI0009FB3F5C